MRSEPPGLSFLRCVGGGQEWSRNAHRGLVLALTFVAYACYHASRKPPSIIKSVLDPKAHPSSQPPRPWPLGPFFVEVDRSACGPHRGGNGWTPFNRSDGTARLGEIDVAFLACYSVGMYAAGHLGDRLDLRLFLAFGMIGSGAFVALFGMGYFWNIDAFGFYLAMMMLAGLFQSTGWPSVVAVVVNWFGERKRGLIMGIWNAHTSVGNISGSLLAASVLQYGWGWSFILPGALIAAGGVLVFFFLAAYPEDVDFRNGPRHERNAVRDEEAAVRRQETETEDRGSAVGILKACSTPGVIPFALCLFFSKLVAYTFLYWLPFYLSQTALAVYMYESSWNIIISRNMAFQGSSSSPTLTVLLLALFVIAPCTSQYITSPPTTSASSPRTTPSIIAAPPMTYASPPTSTPSIIAAPPTISSASPPSSPPVAIRLPVTTPPPATLLPVTSPTPATALSSTPTLALPPVTTLPPSSPATAPVSTHTFTLPPLPTPPPATAPTSMPTLPPVTTPPATASASTPKPTFTPSPISAFPAQAPICSPPTPASAPAPTPAAAPAPSPAAPSPSPSVSPTPSPSLSPSSAPASSPARSSPAADGSNYVLGASRTALIGAVMLLI